MPLSPDKLRNSLKPLFQPGSMPSADAVGDWLRAYIPYANDAVAGALKLTAPLSPAPGAGATFYDALDAALRVMWMTSAWVGPAATGVIAAVPPVQPFIQVLSATLITSFDRDLALSSIAVALHTYTLSIVVTVTPAMGTPFPAPLT